MSNLLSKEDIKEVFTLFEKNNKNPKTELLYNNHFTLLIAIVLSAQSTDASVNKVMEKSINLIDSPEKIIKIGLSSLESIFKTLNIYKNKSKYVLKISEELINKYEGKVPLDFERLCSLPGVGRKTANVVLNILIGAENIAVDTHVLRVSSRLGISSENNPTAMEIDLYKKVPKKFWKNTNHWLVLHGRYICKSKKPDCEKCFLSRKCNFFINKNK